MALITHLKRPHTVLRQVRENKLQEHSSSRQVLHILVRCSLRVCLMAEYICSVKKENVRKIIVNYISIKPPSSQLVPSEIQPYSFTWQYKIQLYNKVDGVIPAAIAQLIERRTSYLNVAASAPANGKLSSCSLYFLHIYIIVATNIPYTFYGFLVC